MKDWRKSLSCRPRKGSQFPASQRPAQCFIPPDLAKLEKLTLVSQMERPQYREAWAWVHFMLHSKPESKAVLLSYLQQLRTQGSSNSGLGRN